MRGIENLAGPDWVLELRVGLVDSDPEIWRRLEVLGSMPLGLVHEVLQVAFGWEDAHLHRFVDSDPFAPLRPVNGEVPESGSGSRHSGARKRPTWTRTAVRWISFLRVDRGRPSMSTTLATAGSTGSNWFPAGRLTGTPRRRN